jgi:hypothetical protein
MEAVMSDAGGQGRRVPSRRHCLFAALATALGLATAGAQASDDVSAQAVMGAFLYKFALFVTWPDGAFASQTSPMHLCIVGDDPFGPTFDAAAGAQRVGERAIEVQRLKTVSRDSGCQIVYIAPSEAARSAAIVGSLQGVNVLTVGEGRGAGTAAPIIQFAVDGRVRLTIDDEAAERNGLVISSKLLSLATVVRPRKPKE